MADPLSIAAAGAGFLSLAAQIADGAIKLRNLYTTVKNAPRDVMDLCDELETLRRLLEQAGNQAQHPLPLGIDAGYLKDAFAQTEKMRFHIVAVLQRLEEGLRKGKANALRFPFKKQEIEHMLLSVERSKTSLLLANQAFESSLAFHRHEVLSSKHTSLLAQQSRLEEQYARLESNGATQHSMNELGTNVGVLIARMPDLARAETTHRTKISFHLMPLGVTLEQTTVHTQTRRASRKPAKTVLSLRLPRWFMQRQYDIHVRQAISGWKFSLGVNSIIPDHSPFFRACRDGDAVAVKELLATHQASIHDRNQRGWPVFVLAVLHRRLDVCRVLREFGAFTQFQDGDYALALMAMMMISTGITEEERLLFRLIEPPGNADPDWFSDCWLDGQRRLSPFNLLSGYGATTAAGKLSEMHRFLLDYSLRGFIWYPRTGPYVVGVLTDQGVVDEITTNNAAHQWIVFAGATTTADWNGGLVNPNDGYRWSVQATSAIVHTGVDPHQVSVPLIEEWMHARCLLFGDSIDKKLLGLSFNSANATPLALLLLQTLLRYASTLRIPSNLSLDGHRLLRDYQEVAEPQIRLSRALNRSLRLWVHGLFKAGIDLVEYATKEASAVDAFRCSPTLAEYEVDFAVGATPKDWCISLRQPYERYAEQFWHGIEDKPIIPALVTRLLKMQRTIRNAEPKHAAETVIPGSWPGKSESTAQVLKAWLDDLDDDDLARLDEDLTRLASERVIKKWKLNWLNDAQDSSTPLL